MQFDEQPKEVLDKQSESEHEQPVPEENNDDEVEEEAQQQVEESEEPEIPKRVTRGRGGKKSAKSIDT